MRIVVVIDDDSDDLEFFKAALLQFDSSIICYTYNDPEEAIYTLTKRRFNPEAIFVDVNMPKLTGDICLKMIREDLLMTSVVVAVVSTSMDPVTREKLMRAGANHALKKPYRLVEYAELIALVLKSSK